MALLSILLSIWRGDLVVRGVVFAVQVKLLEELVFVAVAIKYAVSFHIEVVKPRDDDIDLLDDPGNHGLIFDEFDGRKPI
jgi:hypothetical protein